VSYSEENGQVVLTMSREDYGLLSKLLGWLTWTEPSGEIYEDEVGALVNRLNSGNPNYRPYQVGDSK
jgi:hypothetical protein